MRRTIVWVLTVVMALTVFSMPTGAFAVEPTNDQNLEENDEIRSETDERNQNDDGEEADELQPLEDEQPAEGQSVEEQPTETPAVDSQAPLKNSLSEQSAAGETITGTFSKQSGKDVATIRYYTDANKTTFAFADVVETASGYEYSFDAPYNGFTAVQGTKKSDGNVIAEYYSTSKWDGAVDVSWYEESATSFDINTPAQLAGLAAIVNGSINNTTPIYKVKGVRSDLTKTFNYETPQTSKHQNMNEGLPDCIENKYYEKTTLIAGVEDEAYEGLVKHDFANKVVNIKADLDMGGTDPSNIDHSKNTTANAYEGTYPNWTPIGGDYLMNPADGATMIKASFNGTLNGNGHHIKNLYCYRWSYRSVAETAYGYAEGTGLIGKMGSLYEGESQLTTTPGVRDMSLSGYIYGRRMVGGFVGCMGGGSNASSGTSVADGIVLENLANHAEVHCTDSKGLGGIVACSMLEKGAIINCYNTGYMDANYAAPTGGIIGSNEGMSIYCCYNTGTLYTHGNSRGRGIGCNNSGENYKVDDCYYLEDCGDDDVYPGYYAYNLAKSVSVNTVSMTATEMKNGTLLEKLNVNGTAFVAGSNGYPVLYWEKNASLGTGNLSLEQSPQAGTITATKTGNLTNGTIVYLSNEMASGWKCRYYTLNDKKLSGNYVTVNGNCVVAGFFDEVKPGTIKIKENNTCTVSIKKNGIIKEDGNTTSVTNYPVKNGDPIFEGDVLMVDTNLQNGVVPEDEDLIYKASAPDYFSTCFEYTYSYTDADDGVVNASTTEMDRFTVGDAINEEGITLVLSIKPLTAQKMWDYAADTSWYSDSASTFTIENAAQLAGLSVLVDDGKTFAGKTVKLGKDISLANNDGTSGKRFWDGIGDSQGEGAGFAGTFDGNGHKITDYNGNANGLFEYCAGTDTTQKAVIQDVELWGESTGQDACGIVMKAKNTQIKDCTSYCEVKGTTSNGHTGSIIGYANGNCDITGCVNYACVEGFGYVGGLAGELNPTSTMTGCVNNGNVYALSTGGNNVGGIVGSINGKLYDSANYGNIKAYGRNIGGIAGQSVSASAAIDSCYNIGTIEYTKGTNTYDSMGGIIGFASIFNVKNSYNYGAVKRISGTMTASCMGAAFGREMKNSKSLSEDVFYLDTTCEYAEAGTKQADLDSTASYSKGIRSASSGDFASSTKVLAAINDRGAFQTTAKGYPEISAASDMHVHSGGNATCSKLAVCETCGLAYGQYSDQHGDTKVVGAKDPVWLTNGSTGNVCCEDCGEVLQEGTVIKADPNKIAMEVIVKTADGTTTLSSKKYTVKEFDNLKKTSPTIGYSYGSKSKEIVATTKYVPLDTLLSKEGLTLNTITSIDVKCEGKTNIPVATLKSCNKYYEGGQEYDAPAAFMIEWNTAVGSLKEVAKEAKIGGTIRFGYGISKQQYDENAAVGGARLISPVESLTIYHKHTLKKVNAVAATCTAKGARAYWHCTSCGRYYSDSNGKKEIKKNSWIVAAKGHSWKHIVNKAGYLKNGSQYDRCSSCGAIKNKKTLAGYSTYYVKSFKVSKGKKSFTAKWKKQSKANQKKFNGYQIRYSTSAKMSGAKYVTAAKSSKSKKIKGLAKKKKYYVQVRTYTKSKGVTYYSKWSPTKAVTTK